MRNFFRELLVGIVALILVCTVVGIPIAVIMLQLEEIIKLQQKNGKLLQKTTGRLA
jgi:methylglyoxal synthase